MNFSDEGAVGNHHTNRIVMVRVSLFNRCHSLGQIMTFIREYMAWVEVKLELAAHRFTILHVGRFKFGPCGGWPWACTSPLSFKTNEEGT